MEDLRELLLRPATKVALVGASEDPDKYGSVIFLDLIGKGIRVYPVNPKRSSVYGEKAYATLGELPESPDIVNIVTKPEVSLAIIKQCLALGYMNVWLQPGALDDAVATFLRNHPFNYLVDACTMAASRSLPK